MNASVYPNSSQKATRRKDAAPVIGVAKTKPRKGEFAGQQMPRTSGMDAQAARRICTAMQASGLYSNVEVCRNSSAVPAASWYVRFQRMAAGSERQTRLQDVNVERAHFQAREMQFIPIEDTAGSYIVLHTFPDEGEATCYEVSATHCSCPHYQYRLAATSSQCKHIIALNVHLASLKSSSKAAIPAEPESKPAARPRMTAEQRAAIRAEIDDIWG